jgi:ribonuclease J
VSVRIIALGGFQEVGKNLIGIEDDHDIFLIDCGLMFPEGEMLGVDIVIPDVAYLLEKKDKLRAILLTHGHEDHIGALPYVLPELGHVPIYGSTLTLGLVEAKLADARMKCPPLNEMSPDNRLKLGEMEIEFLRVGHSFPDSFGLCIRTPHGTIVHTSDFKFDQLPLSGQPANYGRFAEIGAEGVDVLISDSTNSEKLGFTPSEKIIEPTFEDIFTKHKGRIFVATFASNVHRVQYVVDFAARHGRCVALAGRSMETVVDIAQDLGYLDVPEGILVPLRVAAEMPREQVTVLTTGAQGEPLSALTRMAAEEHPRIQIEPGDCVIISASPIPGNEDEVHRTINRLCRLGANVIYHSIATVHVSGHGNREDLKMMLNLTRPKFVLPWHGEARMVMNYRTLAAEVGFDSSRIFELDLGDVVELENHNLRKVASVEAGAVLVDGLGDVDEVVLRDRRHLAQDGVVIISVSLDHSTGEVLTGPELITRGFIDEEYYADLLAEGRELLLSTIKRHYGSPGREVGDIRLEIRRNLGKFLAKAISRHPMIIPAIVEV